MHNEDEKFAFNLSHMFPKPAQRARILCDLKRSWPLIVGISLGHRSVPYDLSEDELFIAAENNHTAQLLNNMKGNIMRILINRYNYSPEDKLALKICISSAPEYKSVTKHVDNSFSASNVKVDEDDVKRYMSEAPRTLPQDINHAISHLRAFFEKRFGN